MRPVDRVLTLWSIGLLDSDAVIRWADQAIVDAANPEHDLIELASEGPQRCLKRAVAEFPARPVALSYSQEFSLRALSIDLQSDESTGRFADWCARHAMGQELALPEVALGYRLDHLIDDCQTPGAARSLVRQELPALLARCAELAAPFLEQPGA